MFSFRYSSLLLAAAVLAAVPWYQEAQGQESKALQLSGDYAGTHDPLIGREGNNYYVFATGHSPDQL